MSVVLTLGYLIAAILFILSLRGLSSPKLAIQGCWFGIIAMAIVIIDTFLLPQVYNYGYIIIAIVLGGVIGALIAYKIHMKQLPQLMAVFHSFVGLAAAIIAIAVFYAPSAFNVGSYGHIELHSLIEMSLGLLIGIVTFAGSVIAFLKLQGIMKGKPIVLPKHNAINFLLGAGLIIFVVTLCITNQAIWLWLIALLSLVLGILLIIPIGGADMPVVVSMLNSYSGWATAGIGFTLANPVLVIIGAIVGASGAILSYIMCKGMNRSILNVIFGSTLPSAKSAVGTDSDIAKNYRAGSGEDAAFMMKSASSIIIVPGYGMAVAGAQHVLKEMVDELKKSDVSVKYAIHPVAGRMPGHMNVLLAEAGIPYEDIYEMDSINSEFASTDVVYIIGANDVTNPAAKTNPDSPIYGMPVLEVAKAKTIFFVKRSMGAGYSGIDNELFYDEKTLMLLGDAKAVTENIVHSLKQ